MPVTFSTALPAIATMTSPAKAFERWRVLIAGSSAAMNQSDTNAEATPATASIPTPAASGKRGVVPPVSCGSFFR